MDLSELSLRIVLIFLPGMTSFLVVDNLTNHKETKLHNILIQSFILGFLCYFAYYIVVLFVGATICPGLNFNFFNVLVNKSDINFKEIVFVTLISIPVGLFVVRIINYKILFRIARFLRISDKYANVDVWSYLMEFGDPTCWVVIRDRSADIVYEGWVNVYSDSTERDEIFLRDVKVYNNSTAEMLYETPGVYLSRKREDLSIEFPQLNYSEKRRHKDDK